MFSFFKGLEPRKHRRLDDRIWLTQEAADAGLLSGYDLQTRQGARAVIAFFFEGTLERLRSRPGWPRSGDVWPADGVLSLSDRGRAAAGKTLVLFTEHYPFPEVEQRALEQLESSLRDAAEVVFYCSLGVFALLLCFYETPAGTFSDHGLLKPRERLFFKTFAGLPAN